MTVRGCGNNCVKYLLFIFNLIFLLGALTLLGLSIWALVDKDAFATIHDTAALMGTNFYEIALYIVLAFASACVLITFLGCCGAWKEIRCCLSLFFILIFFLAIGLVVGGILFMVFNNEVQETAKDKMRESLTNEYGMTGEDNEAVTRAWDNIQTKLTCCGVTGEAGDLEAKETWFLWRSSKWFDEKAVSKNQYVPASCCKLGDDDKPANLAKCTGTDEDISRPPRGTPNTVLQQNDQLYTLGCYDDVIDRTKAKGLIIGVIAIITALVMLLAMVFAICLCRAIE